MDQLGGVGVVDDVDGDGLALFHAQDRAGGGAVVADGGEDAVGCELDGDGGDFEGDVGWGAGGGLLRAHLHACLSYWGHWLDRCGAAGGGVGEGEASELEEVASVHGVSDARGVKESSHAGWWVARRGGRTAALREDFMVSFEQIAVFADEDATSWRRVRLFCYSGV